jgi:hypothetical protein
MKPTSEIGFEQMDTTLNDLLEQVQKMRETLLSVRTSYLEQLESLSAKHLGLATQLTLVAGQEKPNLKRNIMLSPEALKVRESLLQYSSRQEESQ